MEEPQIVRYKGGEEFSWHYDEVPPPQLPNGGQRLATLLVYLTDVPLWKGGGTTFRDLKESSSSSSSLVMQPKKGSALLFFPSFADGSPDDRTLHKSEVLKGDNNEDDHKWIVQMWTHQRDYQAVLPNGNSNEAARATMKETGAELGYD
jgi:prolyl 4-hydroxylase